jgi:hypothetical protein
MIIAPLFITIILIDPYHSDTTVQRYLKYIPHQYIPHRLDLAIQTLRPGMTKGLEAERGAALHVGWAA